MTGTVFDIQRFSVHDGPGIRTTVFMKGCPLRCRWCHNPEGLRAVTEVQFFEESCIGCRRCLGQRRPKDAENCPTGALKVAGEHYDARRLLEAVLADREFYGEDGGVTFSGGECLLQAEFVTEMLRLIKAEGISTAIDTCGYVAWDAIESTLGLCDTYLYDIKCADPVLHKMYTGKSNDLILENLQRLSLAGAEIWIRVPVIPGVNDNESEMQQIARIVSNTAGVRKVTLIPYHTLGKSKYKTLGMEPGFDTENMVSQTNLRRWEALFQAHGVTVE